MISQGIAPHESFEIHELLTFKNVCATKSATMSGLAADDELKTILQLDFTASREHIKELSELLQKSAFIAGGVYKSSPVDVKEH